MRRLIQTVMTGGDTVKCRNFGRRTWTIAAAIVSTCAWFSMSGNTAMAQTKKTQGTPYYAYHNGGAKPMLVSDERKAKPKGARISEEEAKKIAVKAVPGTVTDVAIEKKLGANRYVVEVIAADDGAETDVIIEMETGKVLATEN